MNVTHDGDRLVNAYLKYLTDAAEPLPAGRRSELVAEVRSHIAEARAAGVTSEAEIRQMLQRLGDPDGIVAAATEGLVQVDRLRGRDIAALLLLPLGGFVALAGWLAGVFLLWSSDRWTRSEKWLATLVWPLGYVFVIYAMTVSVFGFVLPRWLGITIAVLIAVAPVVILRVLIRNARPGRA